VEEVGRGGASGRGYGGARGSRGAAERKARRVVGFNGEAETGWRVEMEQDRAVK
jgi:ribosomal protein L15